MKGKTDKMVVIIRYIGEVWAGVRGSVCFTSAAVVDL